MTPKEIVCDLVNSHSKKINHKFKLSVNFCQSLQDDPDRIEDDFFGKCVEWRHQLGEHLKILRDEAHDGELAAFASYAIAFPDGFLALVDTYDVTKYVISGSHHTLS